MRLLGLIALCLVLNACGFCQLPANKGTARCIAENEMMKCGPKTGMIILACIPFIVVNDWTGLFNMLASAYPSEAGCIENNLEMTVAHIYGPNSLQYAAYRNKADEFKIKMARGGAK